MEILVIGGGNMGLTYAKSLLHAHIVKTENLSIMERSVEKVELLKSEGFTNVFNEPGDYVKSADLIILAVKPQDCEQLFSRICEYLDPQQLILSIMAGIPIVKICQHLNISKVIRAMPNLPAQVGSGMTVYTSSDDVTRIELVMVQNILNSTGKTLYVNTEDLIDASTAISGSGPAYVYYFIQSLIDGGIQLGFSQAESELLAYTTFRGTLDLYKKNNFTCEEWISKVASRGGTTEAALLTFEKESVKDGISKAYTSAYERAKELRD